MIVKYANISHEMADILSLVCGSFSLERTEHFELSDKCKSLLNQYNSIKMLVSPELTGEQKEVFELLSSELECLDGELSTDAETDMPQMYNHISKGECFEGGYDHGVRDTLELVAAKLPALLTQYGFTTNFNINNGDPIMD